MIAIVNRKGEQAPFEDGVWLLEESTRYAVRGVERVERDEVPLPGLSGGDFELDTGHAVGKAVLRWWGKDGTGVALLDVAPRADKLGLEEWERLIEDLESWLPGLTTGFDGTRHGEVGKAGCTSGWFAEALLPLVPALVQAVRVLVGELRLRTRTELVDEPFRRVRQANRETAAYIARNPEAAAWLDGWKALERRGKPPTVPLRRIHQTLDHPANRYMRWLLERVVRRLSEAATRLEAVGARTDVRGWCAPRARRLRQAATDIALLVRRSPLSRIRSTPPTDAAFAVVVDDPHYARVHALARKFVSPAFSLAESETPASVKPSYDLYELWCFLAVARSFESLEKFTWKATGLGPLLAETGTGGGASFVGKSAEGTMSIAFNRTFVSFTHPKKGERWSLSGERRPDIVVSWRPADASEGAWVFFDAKYRVGDNLVDAFGSAHVYRDSLRWTGFGGAPLGGLLLTPASTDSTDVFFHEAYREEFGIGACVLKPGVDARALVAWVGHLFGITERKALAA